MSSMTKRFDELSLHVRDKMCVGCFDGQFEAEDGAIVSITLDGTRWDTDPETGRYRQLPMPVVIPVGHWLWEPICLALEEMYDEEITETGSDFYDPAEHAIGEFESLGRR